MKFQNTQTLIQILKNGGVAVIPTDTIYGIVGSSFGRNAVERIFEIKGRKPDKPVLSLIGDIKQLSLFGFVLDSEKEDFLKKIWFSQNEKPTTIILDCPQSENDFAYLHRGKDSLAFRLPQKEELRSFLLETGPLVAPSANPEGLPPAKNIEEAKSYFGEKVDFYLDGGEIEGEPSRIIKLNKDGTFSIIRE